MNLPKLRFPEFINEGDWQEVRFSQIFSFKPTNSLSRENLNYINGEVKNIHYGDIHTKFSSQFDLTKESVPFINANIDLTKIKSDSYCKEGDLIIADASEDLKDIGKSIEIINLNKEKVVSGLHTFLARPIKNIFTKGFINYLMQSAKIRLQIATISQGTKVLGLSTKRVANLLINIPSFQEQQKIADCLSSLDEAIDTQSAKITALEEHKKGLMQQLFPHEGETVPRLRFPEFANAGDWEEITLGKEVSFLKGKGLPKNHLNDDLGMPCIHYGQLFSEYSEVIKTVKSKTEINSDYIYSKRNDILMPTSDVTPNGLAKASCIMQDNVILGGDILIIRTEKMNGEFLSRFIRFLERNVLKLVSGTTVFHLYASSLEKFKIHIPSLPEQQKIADCLSSLDDLISAQKAKLEALKLHKKGLMQQLFPSPKKENK